jgi:hypothetical protein
LRAADRAQIRPELALGQPGHDAVGAGRDRLDDIVVRQRGQDDVRRLGERAVYPPTRGPLTGGATRHAQTGVPRMIRAAVLYMLAMFATAFTVSAVAAVLLLLVVGFASITFLTTGNSTIQIAALPAYRGRVTALWSTAFVGSTPIGATIIGAIGANSPRLALAVGGAACGAAVITGFVILAHSRTGTRFILRLDRG